MALGDEEVQQSSAQVVFPALHQPRHLLVSLSKQCGVGRAEDFMTRDLVQTHLKDGIRWSPLLILF